MVGVDRFDVGMGRDGPVRAVGAVLAVVNGVFFAQPRKPVLPIIVPKPFWAADINIFKGLAHRICWVRGRAHWTFLLIGCCNLCCGSAVVKSLTLRRRLDAGLDAPFFGWSAS